MADQTLEQIGVLRVSVPRIQKLLSRLRQLSAGVHRVSGCWVSYLLSGTEAGAEGLVGFISRNHFFPANQQVEELTALGKILAAHRPERALEIGTAGGGTLLFLTRLASSRAMIISIDLPGGKFGGGYNEKRAWFYQRFARASQQLLLLRGDSHSGRTLDRVNAALKGKQLDYLFIDGDHSYAGVKSDFEMYGAIVRRGGLVALHDIVGGRTESVGGVPRFWDEIKSKFRHAELIKDPKQGGWGIGVLYVE